MRVDGIVQCVCGMFVVQSLLWCCYNLQRKAGGRKRLTNHIKELGLCTLRLGEKRRLKTC